MRKIKTKLKRSRKLRNLELLNVKLEIFYTLNFNKKSKPHKNQANVGYLLRQEEANNHAAISRGNLSLMNNNFNERITSFGICSYPSRAIDLDL